MSDTVSFVNSYGVVVKTISDQVGLLLAKTYLGSDGKLGLEDLPVVIAQVLGLFSTLDDFQVLFANKELFLDPAVKPDLQAAFVANFDLVDETAESVTEEIHDIVLSVIKIVLKLVVAKQAEVPAEEVPVV
jgi:hypothetical protein